MPTRYFGFKKESSFGEEAAGGSKYDLTIADTVSLDIPDDAIIELPSLSPFQEGHIPGYYAPEGSFEYPVDVKTVPHFLYFLLGGYTFTAGSSGGGKNKHEFYATESTFLPSFTARVGKDSYEHVFVGCVLQKASLEVEDAVTMMKTDIVARKDKKAEIRTDLNEPGPVWPIAYHHVTVTFGEGAGATDYTSYVQSFSLEYDNGVKEDYGRGFGSRFPYMYMTGEKSCEMSLELRPIGPDQQYIDQDFLERVWGAEDGVSEDSTAVSEKVTVVFDAGTAGTMTMVAPQAYISKLDTSYKGAEARTLSMDMKCEMGTVTLADGSTTKKTPLYVKVESDEGQVTK